MTISKPVLIGAGLVGLYLLSGKAAGDSGGGGSGLGGEEVGDTIITFPELDLGSLWGDAPAIKKDMTQRELDLDAESMPWYDVLPAGGETIGDWFRAQPESSKITSNILNLKPTPYSIHDPVKKASYAHHKVSLPDPVKLGLTPKKRASSGSAGGGARSWLRSKGLSPLKAKLVHSSPKITPL